MKPDFYSALAGKAEALAAMDDYDAAVEACNAAIAVSPEVARAYSDRGFCFLKLSKPDEAINDMEKAGECGDTSAEQARLLRIALGLKADTLMEGGDNAAALEIYEKIIGMSPEPSQDTMFNAALCTMHLGKAPEALEGFKNITTLNPNHFAALNATGLLALQLGRASDAIPALEAATKLEPGNLDVKFK